MWARDSEECRKEVAMKIETSHTRPRENERVNIAAVSAEEQTRRVREAVARRAYQIFETHKGREPQEMRDWVQAESEVMHPFCGGRMPVNGNVWVGRDANIFKEGTIELWVAPRQLTICGEPRVGREGVPSGESTTAQGEKIYEVIDLREEVDPSRVMAKISGSTLEVVLGKAAREQDAEQSLKAAA
jgi:hypothetical protein